MRRTDTEVFAAAERCRQNAQIMLDCGKRCADSGRPDPATGMTADGFYAQALELDLLYDVLRWTLGHKPPQSHDDIFTAHDDHRN